MTPQPTPDLQSLCEAASEALQQTEYLRAEALLEQAESLALAASDFDTLSRLYFPLQEARRQRRQRCGEGTVRLDLLATQDGGGGALDPAHLAARYPQGQLLVAGWRTTAPAAALRAMYKQQGAYAEVFLAARFPLPSGSSVIAVLPFDTDLSPIPDGLDLDSLSRRLPPHTVLLAESQLPRGDHPGTAKTFAHTMSLWEQLHLPFLAEAQSTPLSPRKLEAFRKVTQIDYACERAHQDAAKTARHLLHTTP